MASAEFLDRRLVRRTLVSRISGSSSKVTAPRGVAFVRDDTAGGAAYKVYRARVGAYRFNVG